MATITVEIPDELAAEYKAKSAAERAKLNMILSHQVRDLLTRPARDIFEVMAEISNEAARNGLTEDELARMLKDDRP